MNIGDVIFVKSDSGSESSSAWDDKRLREAYDRATKIADEMVAKRVAMETNSSQTDPLKKQPPRTKCKKGNKWSVGKSCRATYEDDGQEYEAVITDIIDDFECVVKYLGYDNSEVVLLNTLKPSKGRQEIARQIAQAAIENTDKDSGTEQTDHNYSISDSTPSPMKKKKTHKKNKLKLPNLPNFPMLPNLPMDMPIAPPMPFPTSCDDEEQETLSSMLLSWYLSGYYCGLYQGMNRSKKRH